METGTGGNVMDFKYMYGKQADQYSFIYIPKMLVTEKIFTGITIHKKECGGNRQWQNHYLRNWAANTKGKGII
jgi:hypothetical protein